jgi:hypothetical protein
MIGVTGVPDGYIIDDMLVYGLPVARASVIARGVYVTLPDLASLSESRMAMFRRAMQGAMTMFGEGDAMQIQFGVDSGYEDVLAYYDRVSAQGAASGGGEVGEWPHLTRNMLSLRYRDLMQRGLLRRERIAVFFTARCRTLPGVRVTTGILETYLQTMKEVLEGRIQGFRALLAEGSVTPMNTDDLYLYLYRFFNQDASRVPDEELLESFDPEATIVANCMQSDGGPVTLQDGTRAFHYDGRYHAQFVLKRWPSSTTPTVLRPLLMATNQNICVTMNILPLDIQKEIQKEDKKINVMRRMQSDLKMANASVESAISKRQNKVASLASGERMPLEATYIIRIWAESLEELRSRCVAVRTALSQSSGAKHHEVTLPAQAQSLYFASFPGWTGSTSKKWGLYAENHYLADLLPLQSSFLGKSEPEALYLGEQNNLAGIRLFSSGTPHHAFVAGVTRSGKSVLMIDLLTQSDPFFGFTAIVEEGLSYGTYTQLNGGEPIIISADSPYVFNMFDTQTLPLTGGHLNAAVALMCKMIGSSGKEDTDRNRAAMLGEYVQDLYTDTVSDWCFNHADEVDEIARDALATHAYFKQKTPLGTEFLEAFLICREMRAEKPQEWKVWRDRFALEDVKKFMQEPDTERLFRDYLLSTFGPEDFPRLGSLVEMMEAVPRDGHDEAEVNKIVTLLSAWTADMGNYGSFFDGASNFTPNGKIVHFELGMVGKGAGTLKECVGFMVSHWVRQHIVTMPRNIRKRVIFEEIAKFFDLPDGEKIIAEFYAQLGKNACWVCSVTQVYAQIKHLPIKAKLLGNSSLFFLLKQKDKEDLDDLAEVIGIPESAKDRILNYVIPANQPPNGRASYFTCLSEGESGLLCGSLKCVATKPLIYAASSTGEEFEKRRRDLAKYSSVLQGVLEETKEKTKLEK